MLWRFPLIALLAAGLIAAVACGDDDDSSNDDETAAPQAEGDQTVQLEAADFSFSPDTISGPAGSTVTVEFSNTGEAPHDFTLEGSERSRELGPGESETFDMTLPADEIEFFCSIHPDQMRGTITPTDAEADEGASGAEEDGGDEEAGAGAAGFSY
jgi:plastocyanin